MKIKGRFIAVLAAVGLLAALLPALPTGAVAGVVALSGGSDAGKYFSDQAGYNLVKISVTDEDLSPARVGKARYLSHANNAVFDLKASVVGGEKTKVEELSLSDVDSSTPTSWTFDLESTARDMNDDGVLDNDDVKVTVNGSTKAANSGYTVVVGTNVDGGGITAVTVLGEQPRNTDGSVEITYETSEYKFGTDTPLRLAGTEIRYGATLGTATNQIQVSLADSANAQVTTTAPSGAGNAAVVTFIYHVKDNAKNYVSVSTTTSLATGVDRKLSGSETTAPRPASSIAGSPSLSPPTSPRSRTKQATWPMTPTATIRSR